MSELGQVLQRAREEKGITLDDIQRITKIQRRYLEAIERGHFHVLPGHFYARAFIKSYAGNRRFGPESHPDAFSGRFASPAANGASGEIASPESCFRE